MSARPVDRVSSCRRSSSAVTWILLAGLLAAPALVQAEQEASSTLLLPYFEVGPEGSLTTLFAVSNGAPEPASIEITVFTNWGIPVLTVPAELPGRAVTTINLADWIVGGQLPDEARPTGDLEHLQAALAGRRSPATGLFYGSEAADGRLVGYLTVRGAGFPRPDSLWGDYFIVDPLQDSAQGESLIDLEADVRGACRRHALRYLDGGAFDGGTEVMIWTGRGGRPNESGYLREARRTPAEAAVYGLDGSLTDSRSFALMAVEVVDVAELGLRDAFGWLEIVTEGKALVSVRYRARDRFSVALRSSCLREAAEDLPGGGRDEPPIACDRSPAIDLETKTNGHDADVAPGPALTVGDPVGWLYVVTNTGDSALDNVRVGDDQGVVVNCPASRLAPGESMTCTSIGIAVEGPYRNLGTAVAHSVADPHCPAMNVADQDPSHYHGERR